MQEKKPAFPKLPSPLIDLKKKNQTPDTKEENKSEVKKSSATQKQKEEEVKRAPVRRFSPEKSPEHPPTANQAKSKKKKTKKAPDNNFGLLTQLLQQRLGITTNQKEEESGNLTDQLH